MERKNYKKREEKRTLTITMAFFCNFFTPRKKFFLGGEFLAKNRHCIYRGANKKHAAASLKICAAQKGAEKYADYRT